MGKLVRLLENDRNLAVRAMHIVMFGGKRSSSAERQHKVEEYETALADGRGEDILTDSLYLYRRESGLIELVPD